MKIRLLIIMVFLILPLYGYAQEEYLDYTIKKGDTLWDISKEKLEDPFLWPKVWKENPKIKNPNLIYPGQKIQIPLGFTQKQIELPPKKEVKKEKEEEILSKEKPLKIMPKHTFVVKEDIIAASGYIDKEIPKVGKILFTPTERNIIGKEDYVYIKIYKGVPEKGKKYYVIKSLGKVKHPVTKEFIGYLIQLTGVIKVIGNELGYTKAKVIKSFSEIEVGSFLDNYYPIESFPLIATNSPDVHGTIINLNELRLLSGKLDVVYIDKGIVNGLKPGNIFTIISYKSPHIPIGKIQVISVRQKTAVAMIIQSDIEIKKGDYF